ncbi:MAG: hypothetical protein WCE45_05350 [Sedimentisphaerales bacterium]
MAKKESVLIGLVIGLTISMFLLAVLGFWFYLEGSASKRLLDKLALATPGTNLADIKEKLGSPMRDLNQLDEIIEWGQVKNKQFCKDKKLYFFYAVTPTCRAIDVYTDANDVIVYATWYQE